MSKRGRIVAEIPAHVDYVKNLTLCTVLGDDSGVTIGTVEHLLAALRGLSIDNCYIEIDAREVPIMDGSSAPFVEASTRSAFASCKQPRKFIKVLKPIRVEDGDCWGELTPHSRFPSRRRDRFRHPADRPPAYRAGDESGLFRNEISRARTFGFMRDVEKLWKAGLALGASLDNTVAIGDDKIMNPEGFAINRSSCATRCWMP